MHFEESTVPLSAAGRADRPVVTSSRPLPLLFLFSLPFSLLWKECPPNSLSSGLQKGQGGGPGSVGGREGRSAGWERSRRDVDLTERRISVPPRGPGAPPGRGLAALHRSLARWSLPHARSPRAQGVPSPEEDNRCFLPHPSPTVGSPYSHLGSSFSQTLSLFPSPSTSPSRGTEAGLWLELHHASSGGPMSSSSVLSADRSPPTPNPLEQAPRGDCQAASS
ncbi:PREDICTED: LOW QUALITY PROTEIN: uncharacterized protein LOC103586626 [Galeopterus variegatus]|uniref:LOW QUALITY PROTEIN: uncharacterized protein LOC103586626 n=1 Tax=Galeopterus variegatus TaxID=482537 RepID=A0ABM0QCQ9_GALVR|nr:PREDICTED: LOW QUALITY PROTEIN: uncharacterized protein LOC103586626 [Galeopterus variegatus]